MSRTPARRERDLNPDEARFLIRVRVICIGVITASIAALVFATITQDILHLRGSEALVGTLLGGLLLLFQVDGAALVKKLTPASGPPPEPEKPDHE